MSHDNSDAKAFIADLVARSRAAQKQIEHYSQERVDGLIRAMVWSVARPGMAEEIAQFTVDETQLGNYDGKFLKIQRKTRATLLDIIHDAEPASAPRPGVVRASGERPRPPRLQCQTAGQQAASG